MKNIDEIIRYSIITRDTIISQKNGTVTAVLEVMLSDINEEDVIHERKDKIIQTINDFPENTQVSIYYIKMFSNQKFERVNRSKNEIINYIEEKYKSGLEKMNPPVYQTFLSITIPVINKNDLRKTDNNEKSLLYKRSIKKLNNIIKGFRSTINGIAIRLESSQIVQFLSLIINKEYLDINELNCLFKTDIIYSQNGFFSKKPSYIYYDDKYHAVLSQRTNDENSKSRLPDNTFAKMNNVFNHRDLNKHEYIIQHSIIVLSKRKGIDIAERRKGRIETKRLIATGIPGLGKTPEGIPPEELKVLIEETISKVQQTNHKFLIQSFKVHIWDTDLEKLNEKIDEFDSVISGSYKLRREKLNLKAAWYSMFPGNEHLDPIKTCLPSFNIADYMPVDLPRKNYPDKKDRDFLFFNTYEGQIFKYDPFSRQADNFNAMVIGGSGSGKSFLQNNILYQYSSYNPQIAIVDYGGEGAGSYRNYVINQNGTYLEISLDSKEFSINPFEGRLFRENEDGEKEINNVHYTQIMATIERMSTAKYKNLFDNETRFEIQKKIRKYYEDKNNNIHNDCCVDEFAQKYLRGDHKLDHIYKSLINFIGTGKEAGPYANFFRKTKRIENKDVIAFDMAGLKGHNELKNVLVPALLDMIMTNILGDKENEHRRKMLIMDEAWQDLKGGAMKDFMEEMFRTVRKLNGQITIITQRFSDVLNAQIGEALLANTSYYYFVGNNHDPKVLHHAKASSSRGAMEMQQYDINRLINCKSKRDFHLLTPYFSGLLSFYPNKEFIMLATTDSDDKIILKKHMKKCGVNYVTPEVIESAKNEM